MDVPASFGLVLFLAFLVESAVGFGSALVTVSLGGHLMPLDRLFPVFQPLSVMLSLTLVIRGRAHINTRFLFREVLPAMLPGVLVGMALFRIGQPTALLFAVGVAIAVLASFELQRTLRGQETLPLPPLVRSGVLLFAGVIHGLFGTSGPPVVWVATRTLPDKTEFRATLALLWLTLSLLLVAGYVVDGTLRLPQLRQSALLAVPLVLGFVVGNLLHDRVPQRAFRLGVCVLLVVAGVALVLRTLPTLSG